MGFMKNYLGYCVGLVCVVGLGGSAFSAAAGAPDAGVAQVISQFREYCVGSSSDRGERLLDDVELPKTSVSMAARLMGTIGADGSWADIDYGSGARSSWPAYDQLTRILALTVYARRPQTSAGESAKAIAAVHLALGFWGKNDFKCPNWWYNNIGTPKILGTVGILMGEDLSPLERDYITEVVMPRSKLGAMTGQNRVWIAGNNVMKAALTNDALLMQRASTVIQEEVVVAKVQLGVQGEGIEPDWSFHQHGPQQQFGNYGMAFGADITRWAIVLRKTRFALPEEKVEILRHYLLDGQNWVTWRGEMDISACGRQLFPNSPRSKAGTISAIMQTMSLVDAGHAREYTAFVARNKLGGGAEAANDLVGTRYFYKSDYLVHRNGEMMSTLKMHSDRVIGGETVNSENLSGNHLSDGATFFYRSGEEYTDIFPCLNWRMIPGTTAALDESPLTWVKPKGTKENTVVTDAPKGEAARAVDEGLPASPVSKFTKPAGTAFVGAATNGMQGAAAFDFSRDGLKGHKAYFYSNGMTLCLGAGIHASSDALIVTTINQCLLHGEIRLNETTVHAPVDFTGTASTITHDGLQYYFPSEIEINLHAGSVPGIWKSVYDTPSTPKAEVTKDLFVLTIPHGPKPKDASYAYAVAAAPKTILLKALPENRIKVLSNTGDLQAAEIDDAVGAIFWKAGMLTTEKGTVAVDEPCVVLLKNEKGKAKVWVADPTQALKQATLTIDGHREAMELPDGVRAGSTVSNPP